MMVRRALSAVVVTSVLALVGCADSTRSPVASSGAGPAASAESGLGFAAATLDGDTFDGTSLAGKPAVLSRPGFVGDSQPCEGRSHGSTEEVPGRGP
jgi:hypothetical protein